LVALISEGAQGVAILTLIRREPWSSTEAELASIRDKLTRCVRYVLDGELAREHRALASRPWRIAIDSYVGRPDETVMRALRATGDEIEALGGELVLRHLPAGGVGSTSPTTHGIVRLRTRPQATGVPIGMREAIDEGVAGAMAELWTLLPPMSNVVIVERYAHVGHIWGHIHEVCTRARADRVADIPPGRDRDLADALINEEVELAVRPDAKVTNAMQARITARRLELDRECPTAAGHEIGRAAADPRTRPHMTLRDAD
jgi:hypothetical protein